MIYPHISVHIQNEELSEHFNLTQDERFMLPQWRESRNILGFAVLLKSFLFLGYPPIQKEDVPKIIVSWISKQLNIDPNEFEKYRWKKRWWDTHIASIRKLAGFRPFNEYAAKELTKWLINGIDPTVVSPAAILLTAPAIKIDMAQFSRSFGTWLHECWVSPFI